MIYDGDEIIVLRLAYSQCQILLYTYERNTRLYVRLTGGGGKYLVRPTGPDHSQFRPTLVDGDDVRFAQINPLFLHFACRFPI